MQYDAKTPTEYLGIRFTKTMAIDDTHIEELIVKALQMRRQGEDFGC